MPSRWAPTPSKVQPLDEIKGNVSKMEDFHDKGCVGPAIESTELAETKATTPSAIKTGFSKMQLEEEEGKETHVKFALIKKEKQEVKAKKTRSKRGQKRKEMFKRNGRRETTKFLKTADVYDKSHKGQFMCVKWSVIVATVSIVVAVIDVELTWLCRPSECGERDWDLAWQCYAQMCEHDNILWISLVLKSLSSILTLALLHFVTRYYVYVVRLRLSEDASMSDIADGHLLELWWHSELRWPLLTELFVCMIHVPPVVLIWVHPLDEDAGTIIIPRVTCLLIARVYLVIRWLKQANRILFSPKFRLVAALNRVRVTPLLVLKLELRTRPYAVLMSVLSVGCTIIAYVIEVYERSEDHGDEPGMYFFRWLRSMGGYVIGMEPSYLPISFVGKILEVFIAGSGLILLAVIVAVVSQTLELSRVEQCMLECLDANNIRFEKQLRAVELLQNRWRHYWANRDLVEHQKVRSSVSGSRWRWAMRAAVSKPSLSSPPSQSSPSRMRGGSTSLSFKKIKTKFIVTRMRYLRTLLQWKDVKLQAASLYNNEKARASSTYQEDRAGIKSRIQNAVIKDMSARVKRLEKYEEQHNSVLHEHSKLLKKISAQVARISQRLDT